MSLFESIAMAIKPVATVKDVLLCRGCDKYYLPGGIEIGKQYAEDHCNIVYRYCDSICRNNHLKN